MLIKVRTYLYVEVKDDEQAQDACNMLNSGLDHQLAGFPEGDIVHAEVEQYTHVEDEEAERLGLTE